MVSFTSGSVGAGRRSRGQISRFVLQREPRREDAGRAKGVASNSWSLAMTLSSHDGATASIMALAPVIPVLTVASVEDGLRQAKALVAGGLYAVEVTLRTASALAAIEAIAKQAPNAVVGAGTIVSVEQIAEAVSVGARFLVRPRATPQL